MIYVNIHRKSQLINIFPLGKKGGEMKKPFSGYLTDPYEMKWNLYISQNSETQCQCKVNAGKGSMANSAVLGYAELQRVGAWPVT